jgi:beta-galactosidase
LRSGKEVVGSGSQDGLKVTANGLQDLFTAEVVIPHRPAAERLTLAATLTDENGSCTNDWNFWAFPGGRLQDPSRKLCYRGFTGYEEIHPWAKEAKAAPALGECDLLVTSECDEATLRYLEQGGRVLLLDPQPLFEAERVSGYRAAGWDPRMQGGHVGTAVQCGHPTLKNMPCEGWCDLNFYPLFMGAKFVLLDDAARIDPIVRSIDVPQRLSNRGFLFEARVGKGRLLVSGLNFAAAIQNGDPAAAYLLDQLVRYGLSEDFAPKAELSNLSIRPAKPEKAGKGRRE